MNNFEWEDNRFPLAYLITFRTYGTWLYGDERGSMDRHGKNIYGTPRIPPNEKLASEMLQNRAVSEFLLDGKQRACVDSAVRSVCKMRRYRSAALNVRTNHAHAVISAAVKPESINNALKANATSELRARGLVAPDSAVWSRGGSRRYLWKPHHVAAAVEYVLYGQGMDLPNF